MGVVLPFRRPEPRVRRFHPALPTEDPYWLPDALNLRAGEAPEAPRRPPDRSDDDQA